MLRFSVLSLTVVAALTPRRHEVRIVDENVEPLDFAADVDLVGITFMTALAPRAYEIAARFRARGKIVVGGGFHPTLCPEEAAEHLDAVVVGDAEGAWERLLQDAEAGRMSKVYTGRACPGSELRTPVPRRDLLAPTAKHYVTINAVADRARLPACLPILFGHRISPTDLPAAANRGCHRRIAHGAARLHLR